MSRVKKVSATLTSFGKWVLERDGISAFWDSDRRHFIPTIQCRYRGREMRKNTERVPIQKYRSYPTRLQRTLNVWTKKKGVTVLWQHPKQSSFLDITDGDDIVDGLHADSQSRTGEILQWLSYSLRGSTILRFKQLPNSDHSALCSRQYLVLHPTRNCTFSTVYFAICCVVVSQRCHRIVSLLRLADWQNIRHWQCNFWPDGALVLQRTFWKRGLSMGQIGTMVPAYVVTYNRFHIRNCIGYNSMHQLYYHRHGQWNLFFLKISRI